MGSEHGAGWGVVTAIGEFADATVLTGSRHIDEIREWEDSVGSDHLVFVEVTDRRLGPISRWHRIPEFIVYLMWLRKAKRIARSLISEKRFDTALHATFSASWLPTPATNLGIPSVWGPVGGGVTTPRPLWGLLGFAGMLQELLDKLSVRLMALLPATRRSILRATERLLQNEESLALLPKAAQHRTRILNHAMLSIIPSYPPEDDGRYALWVSPLESRKGPQLAIEAIARTKGDMPLIMVGEGPQRRGLERLASDLGVADRVTFTGLIDRSEVVRYMRGATTTIFTGLREEGGLALAEAMYSARRIVVLDHGGAGAIARASADPQRVSLVAPGPIEEVASAFAAAIDDDFAAAPVANTALLDRTTALAELQESIVNAANG
jgi:glycosyltransferase involved in cell wall biosynthesis